MNRQVLAAGLIGLGVITAILVGVAFGLGIPLGSLTGKTNNQIFQNTRLKASPSKTTAQSQTSNGTSGQEPSPNQNTQTPTGSGTDNSAPVPALW